MPRPRTVKNFWPFDRFSTVSSPRVRRTTNVRYKGYGIYKQGEGEFIVPGLTGDDGSWFESVKEAKRFIDASKRHRNPGMRKPTIYEALYAKLGRHPTNAELKAEVSRIKQEAYVEVTQKGGLPYQRKGRSRKRNPKSYTLNISNPAPWFQR